MGGIHELWLGVLICMEVKLFVINDDETGWRTQIGVQNIPSCELLIGLAYG